MSRELSSPAFARKGTTFYRFKNRCAARKMRRFLARAQNERRVVLTHDKDFGELAFRIGLSAECGVMLLRLSGTNPDADNQRALEAIESRTDWEGHFSVITEERVRVRLLPTDVRDEG